MYACIINVAGGYAVSGQDRQFTHSLKHSLCIESSIKALALCVVSSVSVCTGHTVDIQCIQVR